MTFGEQVNERRINLGLTQEELAWRLNISKQVVSRIERDLTSPRLDLVVAMLRIFDCKPNDLLCDRDGNLVDCAQVSVTIGR